MPDRTPMPRPDPTPITPAAVVQPAHHRPPAIEYHGGVPYHVSQFPAQQQIVVQMPREESYPPWLRQLIVIVVLILAVVAVCVGAICAVVIIAGGTIMGIIGAVGANATTIGVTLIGVIVAAGWAAAKVRALTGQSDKATPAKAARSK
jgi:hypothetical protein